MTYIPYVFATETQCSYSCFVLYLHGPSKKWKKWTFRLIFQTNLLVRHWVSKEQYIYVYIYIYISYSSKFSTPIYFGARVGTSYWVDFWKTATYENFRISRTSSDSVPYPFSGSFLIKLQVFIPKLLRYVLRTSILRPIFFFWRPLVATKILSLRDADFYTIIAPQAC